MAVLAISPRSLPSSELRAPIVQCPPLSLPSSELRAPTVQCPGQANSPDLLVLSPTFRGRLGLTSPCLSRPGLIPDLRAPSSHHSHQNHFDYGSVRVPRGGITKGGWPSNSNCQMLRAWSERPLKMTPECKAGLMSGTIKTPTAALLVMGSRILQTPKSVSSTRRPPFDVACDEYLRQFKLLGARAGSSMPMRPADSSPEAMKVRPAFSPSRPRLRPCAWSSQLLAAIGFDAKKLEEFALVGHYPSPNADAKDQLKDVTNPKVDPSLAAMAVPSVVAGEVVRLAI